MKLWRVLLLSLALVVSSAATYIVVAQTQTWAVSIRSQLTQLKPVPAEEIPKYGTYWSLQRAGWPPLPYCPFPELPTYHLYGNSYLIDDLSVDYPAWHEQMRKERAVRKAQAEYGLNAVDAEALVTTLGLAAEEFMPEGGMMMASYSYPAGSFYLKILSANATNASLILHGTTNDSYYELLSRESITNDTWLPEGSLQGADGQDFSPASLAVGSRTNSLFIRARLLTNGPSGTLPLWWQWAYFGATGVATNGDFDTDGIDNLAEYLNSTDPNTIRFSLSVTNQYVNTTAVPVHLSIAGGVPSSIAVLVNDTNAANAIWQPFASTNLSVSLTADGASLVSVGLRGMASNATPSWESLRLIRDTSPLSLVLTNPVTRSGSRPFIDSSGCSTRALSALTWTVADAEGVTNTGSGSVLSRGWSHSDRYHVTNWFECVDLKLAQGTNWVSIQATDWAGTTALTNFAFVFDTNADITAPALALTWPQNGAHVSGDSLTLQAWTDDDTASVTLQFADTNATVQSIGGLVERGGNVWLHDVPLIPGTNSFTLSATDAAGNVNTTNLCVVQSGMSLTVNPLSQAQMRYATAAVSGTVDDPACAITVNGVAGTNDGNGYWTAGNVPLAPGGTVTLLVTAQPPAEPAVQTLLEQEREPFVFTQTYQFKLGYSISTTTEEATNDFYCHSDDMLWSRGVGGTNSTAWCLIDYWTGDVSSNYATAVWPSDTGYIPTLPGRQIVDTYYNGEWTDSYTNTMDAPSVNWMEESEAAGPWIENPGVSYSASSGREFKLLTGGKALRQRQGLFDLSAALNRASEIHPNMQDWNLLYEGGGFVDPATPPLAVPSEQISLGALGNLAPDGHLWKLLSDGVELVATPQVTSRATPAPQASSAPSSSPAEPRPAGIAGQPPSAQQVQLLINWDNGSGNITDSNVTVVVGQRIDLSCSIVWPMGSTPKPISSYQWTIPGYAISNYVATVDAGTLYTEFPKSTNNLQYCWVDGGDKEVSCEVVVGGLKTLATAMFTVQRPAAKVSTITGAVSVDSAFVVFQPGGGVQTNLFALHYGIPTPYGTPGISFSNSMTLPTAFSGTVEWIQVVNSALVRAQPTNGSWTTLTQATMMLDPQGYPYEGNSAYAEDSPGVAVADPSMLQGLSNSNNMSMWLMFKPNLASSCYVPLRRVDWTWSGLATRAGTNWILTDSSNQANPNDSDTTVFPRW